MQRDFKAYLEDMLRACEKVLRYTEGRSLDDFASDEKTIDAVVRNLEILGEASKRIPEHISSIGLGPGSSREQMKRVFLPEILNQVRPYPVELLGGPINSIWSLVDQCDQLPELPWGQQIELLLVLRTELLPDRTQLEIL